MAIALAVNLAVRLPDGPGQPAGIQYQREPFVSGKGRWGGWPSRWIAKPGYPTPLRTDTRFILTVVGIIVAVGAPSACSFSPTRYRGARRLPLECNGAILGFMPCGSLGPTQT